MRAHQAFRALRRIVGRAGVTARGVIHVGAHRGEEMSCYDELAVDVVLVEPNTVLADYLRRRWPDVQVIEAAVTRASRAVLYLTEWSQQSSILPPIALPVIEERMVPVVTLDAIGDERHNLLAVDTQGNEADVLLSGSLDRFDLMIVETCDRERYEGAATPEQIAAILTGSGLRHAHTFRRDGHLADTIWVRE